MAEVLPQQPTAAQPFVPPTATQPFVPHSARHHHNNQLPPSRQQMHVDTPQHMVGRLVNITRVTSHVVSLGARLHVVMRFNMAAPMTKTSRDQNIANTVKQTRISAEIRRRRGQITIRESAQGKGWATYDSTRPPPPPNDNSGARETEHRRRYWSGIHIDKHTGRPTHVHSARLRCNTEGM